MLYFWGKNNSIVRVPKKFFEYHARCCSSFFDRLLGQYWRLIQMTNVPYLQTSSIWWLKSRSKPGTIWYQDRKFIDGSILYPLWLRRVQAFKLFEILNFLKILSELCNLCKLRVIKSSKFVYKCPNTT